MSKTWSSHSEEEKVAAAARLTAISTKNGHPTWLENPVYHNQISFLLNEGYNASESEGFGISGECPSSEKALSDEITKEIKEALSQVFGWHDLHLQDFQFSRWQLQWRLGLWASVEIFVKALNCQQLLAWNKDA